MKFLRIAAVSFAALVSACSIAACSGEDGDLAAGAAEDVEFHGEVRPFDGVDLDTGMQPPASPVQVSLSFEVDAALTVDAAAVASGPASAPVVTAKPSSGKQTLGGRLKAEAKLKIDAGPAQYDGPLPGLDALDIAFAGTSEFDPFLFEGSTRATAPIPETTLPKIPLPGGIPGSIVLTIEKGSFVRSDFRGVCAGVTHGEPAHARYVGAAKVGGELVVSATVELKAPLSKKFDIPSMKVPVPARDVPVDLGDVEVTGGGEAMTTGSIATAGETCAAASAAGAGDAGAKDGSAPTEPGPGPEPEPDPEPISDAGADADADADATVASCTATNACTSAQKLGSIAGDGSGLAIPLTASGYKGRWLVFRVNETGTGAFGQNLKVKLTLSPPAGSQWTFTARLDESKDVASACGAKIYKPVGNTLTLDWGEGFGANGSDDSRNIAVQVRHVSGACPPAAPWKLKVERDGS